MGPSRLYNNYVLSFVSHAFFPSLLYVNEINLSCDSKEVERETDENDLDTCVTQVLLDE